MVIQTWPRQGAAEAAGPSGRRVRKAAPSVTSGSCDSVLPRLRVRRPHRARPWPASEFAFAGRRLGRGVRHGPGGVGGVGGGLSHRKGRALWRSVHPGRLRRHACPRRAGHRRRLSGGTPSTDRVCSVGVTEPGEYADGAGIGSAVVQGGNGWPLFRRLWRGSPAMIPSESTSAGP